MSPDDPEPQTAARVIESGLNAFNVPAVQELTLNLNFKD